MDLDLNPREFEWEQNGTWEYHLGDHRVPNSQAATIVVLFPKNHYTLAILPMRFWMYVEPNSLSNYRDTLIFTELIQEGLLDHTY